jgi:hypothetical protein
MLARLAPPFAHSHADNLAGAFHDSFARFYSEEMFSSVGATQLTDPYLGGYSRALSHRDMSDSYGTEKL